MRATEQPLESPTSRLEDRSGQRSETECISLRLSCLLRCSFCVCGRLQKAFGIEAAKALCGELFS
jgi:hypothetical protein